ncbi:GAF domain-containing sensor histidine kinase [Nocardioides salsibiostraticola]
MSVVLSEFARTLVTDFPIQGILDHLVTRIVDILPIDAAGVSLITTTLEPRIIAGSDESAVRYEQLQTDLAEGPCLAAYRTDTAISIPDLTKDDQFPRFAEGAVKEGLVAVFTFPLRNGGRCLGALDLYRTEPGALDAQDLATAQTLADVTTGYLLNSEARLAMTKFVATVSHELRTPMTSIAGYVELLQEETAGPLNPAQKTFMGAIHRNSVRLTALADDLLTVSSLDSPVGHEYVLVNLVNVVNEARATLEPQIAKKSLAVVFEVSPDPVLVQGDASRLEAIVTNLVSNAIKFTDDGGWVRCTLRAVDGNARIEVSDNGLGIPFEEQQDLFTRFFRSSSAQKRSIQGTGLGLTIVHSIVQNHGGEISVVSEHLEGSSFTVNLPLYSA